MSGGREREWAGAMGDAGPSGDSLSAAVSPDLGASGPGRNPLLSAALGYARRGWHVFPIKAGTKDRPLVSWGSEATADAAKIERWWSRWPDANVGVATGPERAAGLARFFMDGREPYMLEPKSPVLYYRQRLRDEAHRFAIGSHRARRTIEMKKNPLDEMIEEV